MHSNYSLYKAHLTHLPVTAHSRCFNATTTMHEWRQNDHWESNTVKTLKCSLTGNRLRSNEVSRTSCMLEDQSYDHAGSSVTIHLVNHRQPILL